jgi:hypothetical protein
MSVTSPDFESGAYTNFATPARIVGADAILVEATQSGQTTHLSSKLTPEYQQKSAEFRTKSSVKECLPFTYQGCTMAMPVNDR